MADWDRLLDLRVSGTPKPQPRPRARAVKRRNGSVGVQIFPLGSADAWRAKLRASVPSPVEPPCGAIALRLEFSLPRPKRLFRKHDPTGPILHVCKPDADNLAKAVMDELTDCGWWRDDGQVAELVVTKHYAAMDGVPGVRIVICEQ